MIGTPASAISRDQMAYANKRFLEMHAGNQSFFVKRPEIVGILKDLAEVAKVVTRDMAAAGVGLLAGCDAMIAGFCVHDELATMARGGLTPLAALRPAGMRESVSVIARCGSNLANVRSQSQA